jgi:hypothetical protein
MHLIGVIPGADTIRRPESSLPNCPRTVVEGRILKPRLAVVGDLLVSPAIASKAEGHDWGILGKRGAYRDGAHQPAQKGGDQNP